MAYSKDCTHAMNIPVPGLDLPSANGSWNVTTGGSGLNPNQTEDQSSTSRCQSDDTIASKPLILIAEDNKTDVFLIREALEAAQVDAIIEVVTDGYAATQFFDAVDADANTRCPVLVLLDMNLPKRNGSEVLNHLRRSTRCGGARVIIVSSSDAPCDRAAVAALAAAGYFKKPSDYGEFMKLGPLVKGLLDLPRSKSTEGD